MNQLIEQDAQHRALALDANQSFIVQAPAGSGKTELLIQRFLTLLTRVNKPEEILALTFTKKAANEMRYRVLKALRQAAHDAEPSTEHGKKTRALAKQVLQRDAQFQWNLINNPNQLRIQTIDSLCAYLATQLPFLSQFGSQPDIATNPANLYREAVQEVLTHVEENYEWSAAISRLLIHLDNDLNKLYELLAGLLGKRDQWLSYIQFNSNDIEIRTMLEQQLKSVISETLIKVNTLFPSNLTQELLAILHYATNNQGVIDEDLLACQNLISLPGTSSEEQSAWLGIAKLLITKSYSWRKRVSDDLGFPSLKQFKNPEELAKHTEYRHRITTLIISLSDNETLLLALKELFYLPNSHYTDQQWEILQSLLQVLKITAAQLRVTFQQHGQIDFIENTQAALAALGDDEHPTDLALALDYRIQHILIDEFQDTSYTQYQLIQKLIKEWQPNDGRTLFVVGDPMQSIYRFREAEVGLFIRMRAKGLSQLKLIPLTLAVNFRSTSSIVEWNNFHFKTIFPLLNDMATGAVSYSPSVAYEPMQDAAEASIKIQGFVNESNEYEAQHIIQLIRNSKTNFPNESIAILVRSRSHLTAIMAALKKENIAYHAVDIDPLASRPIIQDLLALTRALINPLDRIAWLSVLRAPWCGLSLADLLVIAGKDKYAAIVQQLENKTMHGVNRILPILNYKIAKRERYDLRSWIESTWMLLGGPATLTDYDDIADANAFFNLLNEFSIQDSILNVDTLHEKIKHLYASKQHDDASLHIMTIHSAKGLEFDTVILPQLHKKSPSDDKALLSWMEQPLTNDQVALLLAPIHAAGDEKDNTYEYINRQQRTKADYEIDRLFYVAATRAKKRLYLSFTLAPSDNQKININSGSFLEKIWPQIEKNKDEILSFPVDINSENQQARSRQLKRIKATWINPINELIGKSPFNHQNSNGFQLRDTSSKIIGTVSHRVLQQMSRLGIAWWRSKNKLEQTVYLEYQLKQAGIAIHQLEQSIKTITQILENMLNDERGKWILASRESAKSEYAVTSWIDGKIANLVIDRMFIDEDETLWIIDYKTTMLHDEQEKYQQQMQKYYLALKELYPNPIRLGLYFPALPRWKEWDPQTNRQKYL